MRVVICHAGYSGYMCACWRELAQRKNVELSVYTPHEAQHHPYKEDILKGLPVRVLDASAMRDVSGFQRAVADDKPDIVVIPGWSYPAFMSLTRVPALVNAKFVLSLDSAWRGTWRQIAARFLLWRYLKRMDAVIVAGERGRQFVRYLGVPANKIFTSMYGFDYDHFKGAAAMRMSSEAWPRSFVYVGRYVPVKGCDTLIHAYAIYRQKVDRPWLLHCYGTGPLKTMLAEADSVVVHDFVQPQELPAVLSQHGVYILPSIREPWGVSLAEAAATGMPVICSDRVSSGLDIVRHLYDGLTFAAADAQALARCLLWMHEHVDELPAMGRRAQIYAEAYSAKFWADRWMWCFDCLCSEESVLG